jgi:FeS assembly SUF system regulator
MLRITKIADYGFILLSHMAIQDQESLHNAKDLSETISIPLPTVSKVLKILTQGGILQSHQGSRGGYSLSRSASDITAVEIIEAIEGPVALTDCCTTDGCDRDCLVSNSFKKVNETIISALQGLSLADMVKE